MGVLQKLRSLFKRPHAKPPKRVKVGGHRGTATGDPVMHADKSKWRKLSETTVEGFIYEAQPIFVYSSNVAMVQFFHDQQKMLVEYHGGASYLYSAVSETEAISFAQSMSKGKWIWDFFRVRGSKTAHKKPYVRVK